MGLLNPSLPLVDHKYRAKWADRHFTTSPVKGGVTHFQSERPASRQSARYFSSRFFQWKSIFFLRWVLMLWPYAGGCWEDNRPQCADRTRLPPLAPPFPPTPLPSRATNRPLWEPSTAPTSRAALKHPPPHLHSHLKHLPLSSTSHCPSLCSQPNLAKPSFAVWQRFGVRRWTASSITPPTDKLQPVYWSKSSHNYMKK